MEEFRSGRLTINVNGMLIYNLLRPLEEEKCTAEHCFDWNSSDCGKRRTIMFCESSSASCNDHHRVLTIVFWSCVALVTILLMVLLGSLYYDCHYHGSSSRSRMIAWSMSSPTTKGNDEDSMISVHWNTLCSIEYENTILLETHHLAQQQPNDGEEPEHPTSGKDHGLESMEEGKIIDGVHSQKSFTTIPAADSMPATETESRSNGKQSSNCSSSEKKKAKDADLWMAQPWPCHSPKASANNKELVSSIRLTTRTCAICLGDFDVGQQVTWATSDSANFKKTTKGQMKASHDTHSLDGATNSPFCPFVRQHVYHSACITHCARSLWEKQQSAHSPSATQYHLKHSKNHTYRVPCPLCRKICLQFRVVPMESASPDEMIHSV